MIRLGTWVRTELWHCSDVKEHVRDCAWCVRQKHPVNQVAPLQNVFTTQPMELVCMDYLTLETSKGGFETILVHWGSSHEGSGRHPRQHGGGRGRRFGKFTADSHRVCSFLRPSFCELIVIGVGHIDAEARAAVIQYIATIPV